MLTGRWLASMSPREAAQELPASTDLKQQRQALMQMKPHRAAALLEVRLCKRSGAQAPPPTAGRVKAPGPQ